MWGSLNLCCFPNISLSVKRSGRNVLVLMFLVKIVNCETTLRRYMNSQEGTGEGGGRGETATPEKSQTEPEATIPSVNLSETRRKKPVKEVSYFANRRNWEGDNSTVMKVLPTTRLPAPHPCVRMQQTITGILVVSHWMGQHLEVTCKTSIWWILKKGVLSPCYNKDLRHIWMTDYVLLSKWLRSSSRGNRLRNTFWIIQ